ncbi:MAG: hypothetical protein GXO77_04855 [Calditrichaeota bacterium]|nr:hypothetical protein [Calditrichota bacterium]
MTKSLFTLFLTAAVLFAQGSHDWESVTNMNDVRDIAIRENILWAVSDGGMFRYDLQNDSFEKFTNIEGLRAIDLNAVAIDDIGQVIVGGSEGIIQIYDPARDAWSYQYALESNAINDLFVRNDTLWAAAFDGVGVFVRDGEEYVFKDFFHNFPVNPDVVLSCAVFNGYIWLGTNKGLLSAASDFGKYPINDPQRWKVYTTADRLPNNYVNDLHPTGEELWIGTPTGLASADKKFKITFRMDWIKSTSGSYLPVNKILIERQNIYVASESRLYQYIPGSGTAAVKQFSADIQTLAADPSGNVWAGLEKSGIASTADITPKVLDGPASNLLRFVMKDHNKNIWAAGSRPKIISESGIFHYNGNLWSQMYFTGKYWKVIDNTDVIYEDRFNNLWFGTWGGGLMTITHTGDTLFFHNHEYSGALEISNIYDQKIIDVSRFTVYKNFFKGVVIDPQYEVITAIKEGPNGRLWFANYWAANDNLLAVAPYDANGFISLDPQKWVYFGSGDGIRAIEGGILSLEFDNFGNRVYIGTYKDGVYILDYGNSLDDKSDDQIYHLQVQDNLFSNTVYSLAMDQDGVLWIGTAAGLNSFDGINVYKHVGDERGLSGPLENEIRFILVDNYNNKWFATSGGLSILRGDRSPWDAKGWIGYNTKNSYLISNNVHGIYVDRDNNEALIATEGGLSVYRGAFAEIEEAYEKTAAGPNPYILDRSNTKFVIKNLMFNSTVKIFNINGKLIRELTPKTVLSDGMTAVDGGRAVWDGRDKYGNRVASGIYLYLAFTENGKSTTGKIAIIRK